MNPTVPQNLIDGLNLLATDQQTVANSQATDTANAVALAQAQHAKDVSAADVTAGQGKLVADKAAFIALVNSTFPDSPASSPSQEAK